MCSTSEPAAGTMPWPRAVSLSMRDMSDHCLHGVYRTETNRMYYSSGGKSLTSFTLVLYQSNLSYSLLEYFDVMLHLPHYISDFKMYDIWNNFYNWMIKNNTKKKSLLRTLRHWFQMSLSSWVISSQNFSVSFKVWGPKKSNLSLSTYIYIYYISKQAKSGEILQTTVVKCYLTTCHRVLFQPHLRWYLQKIQAELEK